MRKTSSAHSSLSDTITKVGMQASLVICLVQIMLATKNETKMTAEEKKYKLLYVIRPRDYKTFFMLNSVEHEILNAHKYKNIKKLGFC